MTTRPEPRVNAPPTSEPSDDFLVASVVGGDAAALRKLIDRHDRLVRYTILRASGDRCRRDPQWLESIASVTWEGFVRALHRSPDNPPRSVPAYLVRIARNQSASALRKPSSTHESLDVAIEHETSGIPATLDDPSEELVRLELLEAIRSCLAELDTDEKMMATQLTAITERRWNEAAGALGVTESTLRSRWQRALERLKRCMHRKAGKNLAPEDFRDD